MKPTANALIALVRSAGPTQPKPVGDGWLSTTELVKQSGLSRYTILERMGKLLAEGKAEQVKCPGKTGSVVTYWRLR